MAHRNKPITLRVTPELSGRLDALQKTMPAMPRGTLLRLLLEIATEGTVEAQVERVTRKLTNQTAFSQKTLATRNRLNANPR